MQNTDVSIVPCPSYEPETVREALQQLLAPLGGFAFLKPGMTVALKANLVAPMKKESAATTHPTILAQLTRLLLEHGAARVITGDSPGGLYTASALHLVYQMTGLKEVEEAGGELNQDFETSAVSYPEGHMAKTFSCTSWLQKADLIINVCKLKSHGMMGLSAGAKNLFGVIPGTQKPEYHFRFPDAERFAAMIVDLDEYFHPVLTLCDAVMTMEGNGPTQGSPRKMGALLASPSPHALDLLCSHLIGLKPAHIPTLTEAFRRGLIPGEWQQLKLYGDAEAFRLADFRVHAAPADLTFGALSGKGPLGKWLGKAAQQYLTPRPVPTAKECIGCGKCAHICPAKAIRMEQKLPVIDRKCCIRCFCCQEFCPTGAMKVQRKKLLRLLTR